MKLEKTIQPPIHQQPPGHVTYLMLLRIYTNCCMPSLHPRISHRIEIIKPGNGSVHPPISNFITCLYRDDLKLSGHTCKDVHPQFYWRSSYQKWLCSLDSEPNWLVESDSQIQCAPAFERGAWHEWTWWVPGTGAKLKQRRDLYINLRCWKDADCVCWKLGRICHI